MFLFPTYLPPLPTYLPLLSFYELLLQQRKRQAGIAFFPVFEKKKKARATLL
jgi:hypothetical protein